MGFTNGSSFVDSMRQQCEVDTDRLLELLTNDRFFRMEAQLFCVNPIFFVRSYLNSHVKR